MSRIFGMWNGLRRHARHYLESYQVWSLSYTWLLCMQRVRSHRATRPAKLVCVCIDGDCFKRAHTSSSSLSVCLFHTTPLVSCKSDWTDYIFVLRIFRLYVHINVEECGTFRLVTFNKISLSLVIRFIPSVSYVFVSLFDLHRSVL